MALIYEVWDTQTANQIGVFSSEAEARSLLADVLRVNGAAVASDMTVLVYDPASSTPAESTVVLEGTDFVAAMVART